MQVIATAGHVDHGKSTLVRALTGTDPDRLAEEHRRGLSIQLGYCWTRLDEVGDVAFVDVPGHERFVATMLSGVGPVPAVLFVVAADDPWMPQAAEHLAALDALGVSRGVLAVSRCDLADPAPALARARHELDRTTLRDAPAVAVSGRTGRGLDELRHLLRDLVGSLPQPSVEADVRLWVDRCFHVRGSGTVVTGTLPAGRITLGDALLVSSGTDGGDRVVRVRRIECLGRAVDAATGVARVALNVAGAGVDELDRSSVLVTPGAWQPTDLVDVRLESGADVAAATDGGNNSRLNAENPTTQRAKPHDSTGRGRGRGMGVVPEHAVVHIGATSVAAHVRPLGAGTARVRLDRALPLRIGDRALLRDLGSRRVWGLTVLDPAPVPLPSRRGAAAELGRRLEALPGTPDLAHELRRRGTVHLPTLRRIGVDLADVDRAGLRVGEWLLDDEQVTALRERLDALVAEHDRHDPVHPGVPETELAHELGLPTLDVLAALVRPPLRRTDGRVTREQPPALPAPLERALAAVEADLSLRPFAAPTADRLRELGLDTRAIAAAVKADRLLRLAPGIVLLPGADAAAVTLLAELPQPFTTSEARIRLDTSRRVVLPLLERLDRDGLTERLPDDRRFVRTAR